MTWSPNCATTSACPRWVIVERSIRWPRACSFWCWARRPSIRSA
jgi:hypothetical protein